MHLSPHPWWEGHEIIFTDYCDGNIVKASFFLFIKNSIIKNNFGNTILLLSIPIITSLITNYGIPLLKYVCPTCFNYFAILYLKYGILFFIYPLLIWFILLILYHTLRLYIYYWFIIRQRSKDNIKEKIEAQNTLILELLPGYITKQILKIINEYKDSEEYSEKTGFNIELRSDLLLIFILSIFIFIIFIIFL